MKRPFSILLSVVLLLALIVTGCSTQQSEQTSGPAVETSPQTDASASPNETDEVLTVFIEKPDKEVQPYEIGFTPAKKEYNIYFCYKIIHEWYDPIHEGVKYAAEQMKDLGVTVNVELYAPEKTDETAGLEHVEQAAGRGFDAILWDCTDPAIEASVINRLVDSGQKIMTYASMDAADSKRISYTGVAPLEINGQQLGEEFAKQMNYKGNYCLLAGAVSAANHQLLVKGLQEALAKYPDMKLLDTQYDEDDLEKAIQFSENFIQMYPDLDGIVGVDGTTAVALGTAVKEAGKAGQIIAVGAGESLKAWQLLEDGSLTSLQTFDLFRAGYDTLRNAVMVIDGVEESKDTWAELNYFGCKFYHQEDAALQIDKLTP